MIFSLFFSKKVIGRGGNNKVSKRKGVNILQGMNMKYGSEEMHEGIKELNGQ